MSSSVGVIVYTLKSPNNFGERQDKRLVRLSQEKNESIVRLRGKRQPPSAFGERLKEAFKGSTNREIARKLAVSDVAVGHYVAGRIPPAEMLMLISKLTNTSIHWLVTGEGPAALATLKTLEQQSSLDYSALRPIAEEEEEIYGYDGSDSVGGLIGEMIDAKLAPLKTEIASLKRELQQCTADIAEKS